MFTNFYALSEDLGRYLGLLNAQHFHAIELGVHRYCWRIYVYIYMDSMMLNMFPNLKSHRLWQTQQRHTELSGL